MPRSGSGVFTLVGAVNPVVANTDITATWANSTLDDIAQALTDSLSRNGDGGMNVPLGFADGSVGAPGITWDNEATTGFYRFGTGDMRLSIQNQDMLRFHNNGGNRQLSIWKSAAWRQVIDTTSTSLCDPSGASPGDVPTWSGSAWVPGASGSTIPSGTAQNDILLWDFTLSQWYTGAIPQQIADGTVVQAVLGWDGSDWVERKGLEAGLNNGDGATVRGDLTVTADATVTNLTATTVSAFGGLFNNAQVTGTLTADLTGTADDSNLLDGRAANTFMTSVDTGKSIKIDTGGSPSGTDADTIYFVLP